MTASLKKNAAVLTLFGALALAGCSGTVATRGHLPDPDQLALIQPGLFNRDDIADMLGSPSSRAPFGETETWYYISTKIQQTAFFAPEELERQVVAIDFAPDGMVKAVRTYSLEDAKEIELVDRETPTEGKDLTILQELLSNVGRFSKDAGK